MKFVLLAVRRNTGSKSSMLAIPKTQLDTKKNLIHYGLCTSYGDIASLQIRKNINEHCSQCKIITAANNCYHLSNNETT